MARLPTKVCLDLLTMQCVDNVSLSSGIIVTYLRQILKVLVLGFRRYPILAAVYLDTPLTLICATLYTWLDFIITILDSSLCRSDFYPTEKNFNNTGGIYAILYLNYYGTGSRLLMFQLISDVPRYLFLSYISVKLPMYLYKRLRRRHVPDTHLTREQRTLLYSSLPYSVEGRYVRRLLGSRSPNQPVNRFAEKFRFFYAWRDDFRFSSRVICVYSSIVLLLFFFTVKVSVSVDMEERITDVCSIVSRQVYK